MRPLTFLLLLASSAAFAPSMEFTFNRERTTAKAFGGYLFDIDGTLVNSDTLHFAIFQEMLATEGFDGR